MTFKEFDFMTLVRLLRSRTRVLVRNCAIALVLGYLVAWCIPKEYDSSTGIIPELATSNMSSGLSSMASLAGIDMDMGADAIGPDLYPTVVMSRSFVVDLLYTPVVTMDGDSVPDLMTYIKDYTRMPFWAYGKRAVGKMMKKILPPAEYNKRGEGERIDASRLSQEDEMMVEGVKACISCTTDQKTDMIVISVRAQDPLVAKTMVDTITARLQAFITDYRTSKARVDLQHYKEIEQETREQYLAAQQAYAEYCDSHMGSLLQAYQSEMEALETEMSVALQAYTAVKQQVISADAKVQEQTPAFTVVEASFVPARHSSPKKLLMALAFAFLAGVGTLGWYYVRLLLGKEE